MGTAYTWKTGFFGKVAADVAGKEFERIDREKGLTAQNVVDESRPEAAPLHKVFEWDDSIAGEEWRKHQARRMMNDLLIKIEDKPEAPAIRAIVKLEEAPCYEPIGVVLQMEDKRKAYIRQALKELMQYRQRYADITEFAELFAVADTIIADKDNITGVA